MSDRDEPTVRDQVPRAAPVPLPARGRGPLDDAPASSAPHTAPTAGWGAALSVAKVVARAHEPLRGPHAVLRMNHEDGGFDCPGCAWPDDQHGLHLDFCENGVKHVTWEMTHDRVEREFFASHTVTELAGWSDFALEDAGRLTEPMTYDPASDRYVPIGWSDAFELVGRTLQQLDSPDQATFYTSGRLGNEASFFYQLFVRELGTNNLPDCSNMCHEASGVALGAAIGTGKGTADLSDWDLADAIFVIGVNAASTAPRMLTALAAAERRGAQIVHVNPLVEAASGRTIVPHEIAKMATFRATPTGTLNLQPRIGGDFALMRGIGKCLLELAEDDPAAVNRLFLDHHTTGFDAYERACAATPWPELERQSGLTEAAIRNVAGVYRRSNRAIFAWCLGISQQEQGVDTVREIVNVLLLRGNLGRAGAGPSPVRGHSNVQGNRTCGINHHASDDFLDRLAAACDIAPKRTRGFNVVRSIDAMARGDVKVFVGMGGNFALATPDTELTARALRGCQLTVQVSTKLNRSHIEHGTAALILPCIARSERDEQQSGRQSITVEDSMSCVHISTGKRRPPSRELRSEPAIIAGIAQAAMPASRTPWRHYVDDYDRIRDKMSEVLDGFDDFNGRVRQPHGFRIRQPARELIFLTPSGKAEFSSAALLDTVPGDGRLMLTTVRSHDQWNTTIYTNDDRYRGIKNLRTAIFMHADDMRARGLDQFDLIDVTSIAKDGTRRALRGFRAVRYDVPPGNAAGYMPELNVLCPLGDFAPGSEQPLMKQLLVEIAAAR